MSKIDIVRLDSVTNNDTTATATINTNFNTIKQAFENTLSRDGTTPNFMDADLDMNTYRIINTADPTEDGDVITKKYFDERVADVAGVAETAIASANQAQLSAQNAYVASQESYNSSVNSQESAELAEDWATKTDGTVDGEDYSAKHYALYARPYTAGTGIDINDNEISVNLTGGTGITTSGATVSVDADVSPTSGSAKPITSGAVYTADANLQSQIDAITSSSDVHDIVGTKAALNSYDTSTLTDNDIIKVLQDESQSNATTYYRWDGTAFVLIGSEGPYYTQSAADNLFSTKANTGYSLEYATGNMKLLNNTGDALSTIPFSTIYPVVETYVNGTSWYRVYSDGWVEQGGINSNNSTSARTQALLKPFTDTNYSVIMNYNISDTDLTNGAICVYNKTTSSFIMKSYSSDSICWMACGYGA